MNFPFFKGIGEQRNKDAGTHLPKSRYRAETAPEYYDADPDLADAVNVALLMGRPLLLTGDPGTGKTQLAYRLAWELGLGEPEVFATKSTSTAQDLFYTFDTLGRFHDVECHEGKSAREYITYNALGRAILLAMKSEDVSHLITEKFGHDGPRRCVVLIDEIDKAPRDFPNDILNEIEKMCFHVREINNERVPTRDGVLDHPPVVVITSNSERHLPGPFLRRCAYHHIEFPEPEKYPGRMQTIVLNRLRHIPDHLGRTAPPDESFVRDAAELFFHLRTQTNARFSTGELIAWIQAMLEISGCDNPLAEDREAAVRAVGMLAKTREAEEKAKKLIREWKKNG